MRPLRRRCGRKTLTCSPEELDLLRTRFTTTTLDMGTGDGAFVYRLAREQPDTLCIGVDAVAEAMDGFSAKAARKPARGGAENALFLVAALEDLPAALTGVADRLTVNYPWGSLLRAAVGLAPESAAALFALGKPGAPVDILINTGVLDDDAYRARIQLDDITPDSLQRELPARLATCGLTVTGSELQAAQSTHRTTWGQRLVRGSGRPTLWVHGRIRSPDMAREPGGSGEAHG